MNYKICLLDCTLRDGGYVNNWEFDHLTAKNIIRLLEQSNVDVIECGILGENKNPGESTKFCSIESVEAIIPSKSPNCMYTVMLNYVDKDKVIITKRTPKSVDAIRVAYFKSEYAEAVEYAKKLIDLGYLVFLQAMATYMYSQEELIDMIKKVNDVHPYAFALVDSFGTLYNEDIEDLCRIIDNYLDKDIMISFHAHNNLQMANSNSLAFILLNMDRDISIDVTVFGMGRGAGNAGTEIIMQYMNTKKNAKYDISKIIDIYNKYLLSIFKESYWGYSAQYFLTSQKNMNSAYVWFFNRHGITELDQINILLDEIPVEHRYYLNSVIAKKVIDEYREKVK